MKDLVKIKRVYLNKTQAKGNSKTDTIDTLEEQSLEEAQSSGLESFIKLVSEKNRGYRGSKTKCSKCGKHTGEYKDDVYRTLSLIFGEVEVLRSKYICKSCGSSFYPLDEELNLSQGKYQGRMKKKSELLGTLNSYQQGQRLSSVLLETEVSATQLRKLTENCSDSFQSSQYHDNKLEVPEGENLYIQIDGNMCPTRDERKNKQDNGYREAKTIVAFTGSVEVSKNRHEITKKATMSEICNKDGFTEKINEFLSKRILADENNQVVAIADGAHWIWDLVSQFLPQAVCILDYTHAKQYLYKAAEAIYGKGNDLYRQWLKEQQDLLFQDKVTQVIENIRIHNHDNRLDDVITYLQNNASRMKYGTYTEKGYFIGSGTIESTAKAVTQFRLKGPGMRWNIHDANKLLALRSALDDGRLHDYWNNIPLAA